MRSDCSENIIFSFTRELDMESDKDVSAMFFTFILSLSFCRAKRSSV